MYIDAERMKAKRRQRKLSQEGLARLCDMSTRQVQRYEAGQGKPEFHHLLCLAKVLGVSHVWLLGLSNNEMAETELRPDQIEVLRAYESNDIQAFALLLAKKWGK